MDAKERKKTASIEEQEHTRPRGGAKGWDDTERPDCVLGDCVEQTVQGDYLKGK